MVTRLASTLVAVSVALFQGSVRADYSTTINPQVTGGKWEGWGTSLCWWAKAFGTRDDLADILFTTNYTLLNGKALPGLGLNIARYNAGAGSPNTVNGKTMKLSPKMLPYRQMEGYWLDGASTNPASASWSWTIDANQRAMLLKARARGANLFELFSNSPMWWLCHNRDPSGAEKGDHDNLPGRNYQKHAEYLATIARYASDHWGIQFDSVEPFNEPVADWWTAGEKQEGCHYNPDTQAAVINQLRNELDRRDLTSMKIAASDESYYDQALSTWKSFDLSTKSMVGRVNVHGYQYGGGRRDLLYKDIGDKRLWNSEYGENDATGISLASNLNLDLRWLHPTAWCYWQPFDGGGWGLIKSKLAESQIGGVNPKYYVLAQYTRHIRPGMTLIDGGGTGNTIAAYDAAGHKLVIVTTNYKTPQKIHYNLSKFFNAAGPIVCWTTMTSAGPKYKVSTDITMGDKSFSAYFSTNTIQTFEVFNVDLRAPTAAEKARDAE